MSRAIDSIDDAGQTSLLPRRTFVRGVAWSLPVVAVAVTMPRAAASAAARFDLVYVEGPFVNAQTVRPGQTPFLDFTFQNVGPDPAPFAQVTYAVPTANNDTAGTNQLIADGSAISPGWTLVNTYQNGPDDIYAFRLAGPVPVGQFTVRFRVPGGSHRAFDLRRWHVAPGHRRRVRPRQQRQLELHSADPGRPLTGAVLCVLGGRPLRPPCGGSA